MRQPRRELLGKVNCTICEKWKPCPVTIRKNTSRVDHICHECWLNIVVAAREALAAEIREGAGWLLLSDR